MKFTKYFTDYSENCTIQGVKYVGENNRHMSEKIFWLTSIIICFMLCSFTISEIYEKWNESPVLLAFAEKTMSITEIPFPAVTICPVTQVVRRKVNFTECYNLIKHNEMHNLSSENLKNFEVALHVCSRFNRPFIHKFLKQSLLHSNEIVDRLFNISIMDTFSACEFRRRYKDCATFFKNILTSQGICSTFNKIRQSEMINQEK